MELLTRAKRDWSTQNAYTPDLCQGLVDWMEDRCANRIIMQPQTAITNGNGSQRLEVRAVTAAIPQISQWCYEIGIGIRTAQNWCKVHPEFGEAYARARQLQESFVLAGLADGTINSNAGIFIMKNLFRDKAAGGAPLSDGAGGWSDRHESRLVDENGNDRSFTISDVHDLFRIGDGSESESE